MTADVHALAGAYAIHALPDDEEAFFERHLAACGSCQRDVAELRATAATLGAAVADTPPASLRARVLAESQNIRQLPPESDDDSVAFGAFRRWSPLLRVAATVAAVAVVGLGLLSAQLANRVADLETRLAQAQDTDGAADELIALLGRPDAQVSALDAPAGTQATLLHSQSAGQAVVVTTGLDRLPEQRAYQLWVLRDGVPQPDRVFIPDRDGRAVVDVSRPIAGAELVAITIEPRQGSAAPTGDILIQGPVGA